MIDITVATRNAHKLAEIAAILPHDCRVHSAADYPELPTVVENGKNFAENAAIKALSASAWLGSWVLADDSGLCVEALNDRPGVYSARYAGKHGDDAANNSKLLAELRALPGNGPYAARFVCAVCLAHCGQVVSETEGKLNGSITLSPAGDAGFGYDPLFIPDGYTCTLAQMPPEMKNRISHRAQALRLLRTELARLLHNE